jgi:hypothetical protein
MSNDLIEILWGYVANVSRKRAVAAVVMSVTLMSSGSIDAARGATLINGLHPQIVTSAPATQDIYAFVVSSSFKDSNTVERSTNGGASFRPMGAIPLTPAPSPENNPINQLDFPSATIGFAVGVYESYFYLTRDAGRLWNKESIPGITDIQQLATTKTYVYAVAAYCPKTTVNCTDWRLERSPISSLHWTSLKIPFPLSRYGSVMNVTAFGSAVWLSTVDQVSEPFDSYVAESRDWGESFHVTVQPLLNSANACGIDAMSYDVLWAICDQGNMAGQIIYSDDGGDHWVVDRSNSVLSQFQFGSFDPVNARLAIVANGLDAGQLDSVTNASARPRVVGAIPNHRFVVGLDYLNRLEGVMLTRGDGTLPTSIVWHTDDGGVRWKKVL